MGGRKEREERGRGGKGNKTNNKKAGPHQTYYPRSVGLSHQATGKVIGKLGTISISMASPWDQVYH